jgi:hypothetical protein
VESLRKVPERKERLVHGHRGRDWEVGLEEESGKGSEI